MLLARLIVLTRLHLHFHNFVALEVPPSIQDLDIKVQYGNPVKSAHLEPLLTTLPGLTRLQLGRENYSEDETSLNLSGGSFDQLRYHWRIGNLSVLPIEFVTFH